MKHLEIKFYEEHLRELEVFILEKWRLRGMNSHCPLQLPERRLLVRWGPVSSIVPTVRRPKEMALNWDRGYSG